MTIVNRLTAVIAVAAAGGLICTAPAAANGRGSLKDPPPRAAPAPAPEYFAPAPVYNWTGLYLGLNAGQGLANVDHYYDRQNGKNDHGQVWLDASGFTWGAHAGYNYMMPSLWVIGIEGEFGQMNINTERIVIKDDDVLRANIGMYGTLRGRLGYAFGNFMSYVTAGVAFVDVENAGGNPANANRFLTISERRPGFAVGAGAELALAQNIVGRLEYLYIDTEKYEVRNLENEMMTFDNNFHLIRAGLSWKF